MAIGCVDFARQATSTATLLPVLQKMIWQLNGFFAHGTTKIKQQTHFFLPRCSMYGIFTYIWVKFYGWHAGKYSSPMEHMGKETKIWSLWPRFFVWGGVYHGDLSSSSDVKHLWWCKKKSLVCAPGNAFITCLQWQLAPKWFGGK